MNKLIAIHQPNFFPWLGNFDKMVRSDFYIFLDHVQFSKKGGTWSNRVKLIIGKKVNWLTAPIIRNYTGMRPINEMEFQSDGRWRNKILKTIHVNYAKAPCYGECMEVIEPLILYQDNNISKYNCHAILTIAERLGISRNKFYWSSDLKHNGSANELLISLTKEMGGGIYLSGDGSDEYLDEDCFKKSDVKLQYQNFKHPEYTQFNLDEFQPGLSIIDVLMNIGFNETRILLGPCDRMK